MGAATFFIWFGLKTQFGSEKSLSVKVFLLKFVTFLKGHASLEKCLDKLVHLQRKTFQEKFSFSCTSVAYSVGGCFFKMRIFIFQAGEINSPLTVVP